MGDGTETAMLVMSLCLMMLGIFGAIAYFTWFNNAPSCTTVQECPDPGMYAEQDFGKFLFDLIRIFEKSIEPIREEDIKNRFMFSYMKGIRCCYLGTCLLIRLPRLDEVLAWVHHQRHVLKDNARGWFDSKTRTVTFSFPLEDAGGKVYYTIQSIQIPDVNPTGSDLDSLGIPRESFIKSVIPKLIWTIRDQNGQVTSTSLDVSSADIMKLSQTVIDVYSRMISILLSAWSVFNTSTTTTTDPVKYQPPPPSPSARAKKKKKKKNKKSQK
jgi:hypothetical protein